LQLVRKSEGVDFRLLHQAADRLTPKLRRTLLAAFENLPEAALQPLIAALEAGRIDEVIRLLQTVINATETAEIAAVLGAVYVAAANLQGAQFVLRFDIKNPRAIRWAESNAGRLITGIEDQLRLPEIRDIIVRGIQDGMAPAVQARHLRDIIGLSTRDQIAKDNFLRGLLENATTDRQIAAAEERAAAYGRRLLRARAETIARTETINAASAGQRAAWEDAADAGLIDPQTTNIVWVATEDSRTCVICSVLDGETIGFREQFVIRERAVSPKAIQLKDGKFTVPADQRKPLKETMIRDGPTAHPRCRCGIALVEV